MKKFLKKFKFFVIIWTLAQMWMLVGGRILKWHIKREVDEDFESEDCEIITGLSGIDNLICKAVDILFWPCVLIIDWTIDFFKWVFKKK